MHKILNTIFLFSIISIIECNDEEILKGLRKTLNQYYPRLEFVIDDKICDESTVSGVLNYDEKLLTQIDECEIFQDMKFPNNSYVRPLCKKQVFLNQNHNQVLYNSRCNSTEYNYWSCVSFWELNITGNIQSTDTKAQLEEKIKKKADMISCYQKAFNSNIPVNDTENFLGKYAFERYRLNSILLTSGFLINDPTIRNETFNNNTEDKKYSDFVKCYELLSVDCYAKFNSSYASEYATDHKNQEGGRYTIKHFIIDKMQYSPELVRRCQTEKYGSIKFKEYYEKESKNLQSLIDCQKNALALSEKEKLLYSSEQSLKDNFKADYV